MLKNVKVWKNISDFSYFGAKQHFNKNEPKSQVLSLKYFCAISFITDNLLFRFVDILIKWHCNWCQIFKNTYFAFIYNKLLSMPYVAFKKKTYDWILKLQIVIFKSYQMILTKYK